MTMPMQHWYASGELYKRMKWIMMMMITCINRVIMDWPHITSHEQFSSVVRQNRDIITPDSSAETSSDSEVFHNLSENRRQTFVFKPPILKTVTFTMSTKFTKTSTTTTTTTTSPSTPPIYTPPETSILTYDGTTSAGTFIVKFNQIAKQFARSHNQKCAKAVLFKEWSITILPEIHYHVSN
jgi:hypothetical protein